jgi:hypothetical protein
MYEQGIDRAREAGNGHAESELRRSLGLLEDLL